MAAHVLRGASAVSSLSTKTMTVPSVILVFSGKRKSGKDFITDLLQDRIGMDKCAIMRLSAPLKKQYAIDHGLDYERLLGASDYKERFRADMIQWGEDKRNADPGFFARIITSGPGSEKPVWMISDARRQTDVAYFLDNYPGKVMTVRVKADESIRVKRGWVFTPGVDDAESECGLDTGVNFDLVITNNGSGDASLEASVGNLVQQVLSRFERGLTAQQHA